jgi:hypothetical protein
MRLTMANIKLLYEIAELQSDQPIPTKGSGRCVEGCIVVAAADNELDDPFPATVVPCCSLACSR